MSLRVNDSKQRTGTCVPYWRNCSRDQSRNTLQISDWCRNFNFHKRNGTASDEGTCDLTERNLMLWTIFVILLVLWLLGLVSSYTLGGFIHILLVIAIVVLILQLIQGRRPL